ncbi:DUF6574 domain-containing protein [Streptococcus pantholopis]|uniref:Uncharacterized protein n=1 Tax=Streptococcus pantholopis TaxID=1811193 RepID=A0A172Q526_9STRE|nr:DUF6574 domain-containing protein [Streptococcus pantholopis]AND78561.1 hypothetical protein A0O21_00250 [Streptococcus pantholopis]
MKKEDWVDYFAAINGRMPSDEEIAQALMAGEFVENDEETGIEKTAQNPGVKPSDDAVPQLASTVAGKGSSLFKDFWGWLVSAWQSPTSEVPTNKYNGYVAFGLLTLFYTIAVFVMIRRAVGIGTFYVNNFSRFFGEESSFANPVGPSAFFMILIAAALYIFSVIFSGFVARRLVYKETDFTFSKSFEWYGRLFSINIILSAVSAFFALIGLSLLSFFVLSVSVTIFGLATTFALAQSKNVSGMDMFYKYLIAILVNAVIMFLFSIVEFSILARYIREIGSSFFY